MTLSQRLGLIVIVSAVAWGAFALGVEYGIRKENEPPEVLHVCGGPGDPCEWSPENIIAAGCPEGMNMQINYLDPRAVWCEPSPCTGDHTHPDTSSWCGPADNDCEFFVVPAGLHNCPPGCSCKSDGHGGIWWRSSDCADRTPPEAPRGLEVGQP